MKQKLAAFLLLLISAVMIAAQTANETPKTDEKEKLRKEAVEFLRETVVDINNMRSLENRISFGAEIASLMWFNDEKEARQMYQGVDSDFRRLLLEFDAQMNDSTAKDNDDDPGMDITADKAQLVRKFQTALQIRRQISLSLAEHEPDMAMAFYYDSVAAITNPDFRKSTTEHDIGFEIQLMTMVAETNAAKAAQFGAKSLDNGVTFQHIELLKKIYGKDADKGAEFAAAMVIHIKSNKLEGTEESVVNALIEFGEETSKKGVSGKKPLMDTQDYRSLAEILAVAALQAETAPDMGSGSEDIIAKYAPSRSAQIKAKFKKQLANPTAIGPDAVEVATGGNETPVATVTPAVPQNVNSAEERKAKALEDRANAEMKMMEDIQKLDSKTLPKEDRDKIVSQARRLIARTPDKNKRLESLCMLAAQVAGTGDKETAADIMKDAEALVNPQPKNYLEFLRTWTLITAYAESDPQRAYPILTDTVQRLNDTITGFVRAAEFLDTNGEMIDDGEIQVGQFGGSMIQGLTGELNIAEPTLQNLAKADFTKMKAVTNSFDRPE
ncbi:MAG TPA: hypothetical protein VHQ01_04790, partial [Pyrinomonadaceae bacterium]|nr:hypothetical protein [Pyrinomonadaceae bacterium]